MVETTERFGLIPVVARGLLQPDEGSRLKARPAVQRLASGVLGTEMDVTGEYLPNAAFWIVHAPIIHAGLGFRFRAWKGVVCVGSTQTPAADKQRER